MRDLGDNPANFIPVINTGGIGFLYEHWVQAYFLLIMLMEEKVPFLDSNKRIYKITYQSKAPEGDSDTERPYFATDDVIVYTRDHFGNEAKIIVTIKIFIDFIKSKIGDVIVNAYRDIESDNFSKDNDIVLLATPVIDTKKLGLLSVLKLAKDGMSYADLFNSRARDEKEKEAINCIKNSLAENGITSSDDKVGEFLKNFDILIMDFRFFLNTDSSSAAMTTLLSLIGLHSNGTRPAEQIWAEAHSLAAQLDSEGATIEVGSLPLMLQQMKDEYFSSNQEVLPINNDEMPSVLLGAIDANNDGDVELFQMLSEEGV